MGPQFLFDALGPQSDGLRLHFFDNTDPDGMDRVLGQLGARLATTLVMVISKSGGTVETRNGMLEAEAAWRRLGLSMAAHTVAITQEGSALFKRAEEEGFIDIFPMWDWVGGRTSVLSAVGLLPAALAGIDTQGLLEGARLMDEATRRSTVRDNPAAMMALAWHFLGDGRGQRDLVVLPYKDRLLLFGRYLQQLVMESLGKDLDRDGRSVGQGLVVYGNKGSTDQHAYVQQLRDGPDNFFVTFIDVLKDRSGSSVEVEEGLTTGDYLLGFLLGTRQALSEKGRASITLTIPTVDSRAVGGLIALFERTVGLYASLINVNAYHQPGVEAGKKAAGLVVMAQREMVGVLQAAGGSPLSARELFGRLEADVSPDVVVAVLEHLAASQSYPVRRHEGSFGPFSARFAWEPSG